LIGEAACEEKGFIDATPEERVGTDDVFQLIQLFVRRNSVFNALIETDEYEDAALSSRRNYEVVEKLLDASFFDVIREEQA